MREREKEGRRERRERGERRRKGEGGRKKEGDTEIKGERGEGVTERRKRRGKENMLQYEFIDYTA